MTKREYFERVVKELNLDTRDPFTLLFANACALMDQRDALKKENDALRQAKILLLEIRRNTHRSSEYWWPQIDAVIKLEWVA